MIYCFAWKIKPYYVVRRTIEENEGWSRAITTTDADQCFDLLSEGIPTTYQDRDGKCYYTVPDVVGNLIVGGKTFEVESVEIGRQKIDEYLSCLGIKLVDSKFSCLDDGLDHGGS